MILKILRAEEWSSFCDTGVFHGAPVDIEDGYIHFSTPSQVAETAAKHFHHEPNLTLAMVDPEVLGDNLKWEPSRGGALFPHLYGVLAMQHISWARPLPLGPDGLHIFPEFTK